MIQTKYNIKIYFVSQEGVNTFEKLAFSKIKRHIGMKPIGINIRVREIVREADVANLVSGWTQIVRKVLIVRRII